jgi:hypothetical protein
VLGHEDVQVLIDQWREHYNTIKPHPSPSSNSIKTYLSPIKRILKKMSTLTSFAPNNMSREKALELNSQSEKYSDSHKVAILLCTHQGQRFLLAQLASFEYQTHTNWELWASDDGSKDDTKNILKELLIR